MSRLHEPEISNTRKIAGYIISILPSMMILFSGMAKIMGVEFMEQSMNQIGILKYMTMIGVLELICLALYWIPKTSNLGFFLLCSYAGGIIVGELIMDAGPPIPGLIVATMFYVGTMLRKPYLSGLKL